jgi:hypothetical protein
MPKPTTVFLSGCLVFATAARAAKPKPPANQARETIRAWLEAEDTISKEKEDWAVEKTTMAELLALHRKELALLDEELSKAGMSASGHDERMKNARAELQRLQTARRKTAAALARQIPRILRLAAVFPKPLRAEANDDLATLEAWKPADEVRDALRALLGTLSKAEAFNRRVTRTRDVRNGREVDVLYLGLARAYYLGAGTAGLGQPGPDGWTWREEPDIAPPLKHALAVLDKKRPPEILRLPVQTTDPAGKEARK